MADMEMPIEEPLETGAAFASGTEDMQSHSMASEVVGVEADGESEASALYICYSNADCKGYAQQYCGIPSIGFCEPYGSGYGICDCVAR